MEKFGVAGSLGSLTMLISLMGACSAASPSTSFEFDSTDADVHGDSNSPTGDDASYVPSTPTGFDAGLGAWHPGTSDAGSASGGGDGGAPVSKTLSATIGPIPLVPNQETTVCVTMQLSNTESLYIPRMTVDLALGSHHLIVYRSKATAESLTPTACSAFEGITKGEAVPLMISEKLADDLTFPQGVALKIAPHQMIGLEAHYINTGTTTLQGMGTVHFETVPVTTANVIESDLAFFGRTVFALPGGKQSVGPLFASGLAGTHAFALTTHQHRLGTEFKVWAATSASDVNHTPVADTTDWANPPLYRLSPELAFDGTNGVAYQCTWNNTTGQLVTFGESARDEMCFMWMYYYPSHGFDMRFQ